VIMQMAGIKVLLKKFKTKEKIIKISFLGSFFSLLSMSMGLNFFQFVFALFVYMIFRSVVNPLISTILSERTKNEDQGYILGINQSYISLGQIIGPLSAGLVSKISISAIFIWASILMYGGFLFIQFSKKKITKVDV